MEANNNFKKNIGILNNLFFGWHNQLNKTSLDKNRDANLFEIRNPRVDQAPFYYLKNNENDRFIFQNNQTEVEYNLNKQGFRTDNFKAIENGEKNILISGCSMTFGTAMPLEKTWPEILKNKLNKNDKTNVYNLGVSGLDTTRIISNCYNFITEYGIPDYILLVLPPIYRSLIISRNLQVRQRPMLEEDPIKYINGLFEQGEDENFFKPMVLYNNIISLINLESFCKINNIKLIWFSWDESSQFIYENLDFKNILTKQYFLNKLEYVIEKYEKDLKKDRNWDFADDKDHPGLKLQLTWSEMFYDCITK